MELSSLYKAMKKTLLVGVLLFGTFFTACSTKEVYEPKSVQGEWEKYEESKNSIVDTSANIALLDNGSVLTNKGIFATDINASQRVISHSNGWVITASIDGRVELISEADVNITKEIDLKKSIAGASIDGNDLAVLFADNEIAIYDLTTKQPLFKEQEGKYIATDSRIVNPFFMRGLVLFATLDGKVVFVNKDLKKRLRTVIVSSEEDFNNVISLSVIENKIVAATGYKILSLSKKEFRVKYELRTIVDDGHTIFIATKQGEIISLTPDLQVVSKIKLPFAHFYGMISVDDKLYVLEKEGYMIVVDKNSFDYTVHEVDFDDGYIFIANKIFYIDDKKILTK